MRLCWKTLAVWSSGGLQVIVYRRRVLPPGVKAVARRADGRTILIVDSRLTGEAAVKAVRQALREAKVRHPTLATIPVVVLAALWFLRDNPAVAALIALTSGAVALLLLNPNGGQSSRSSPPTLIVVTPPPATVRASPTGAPPITVSPNSTGSPPPSTGGRTVAPIRLPEQSISPAARLRPEATSLTLSSQPSPSPTSSPPPLSNTPPPSDEPSPTPSETQTGGNCIDVVLAGLQVPLCL